MYSKYDFLNVYFFFSHSKLDTNQGRFVVEANGDLTIVQVKETDSGTYVCIASNGFGAPVQREITLNVQSKFLFEIFLEHVVLHHSFFWW